MIRDYVLPVPGIEATIRRAYPDWKIVGLVGHFIQAQHTLAQIGWKRYEPKHLSYAQVFADRENAEGFSFLLTHENGGECQPDYWAWEIGQQFTWKPGDHLELDVNQGWRPARVLAVLDPWALVEYAMPAGTTALQIIQNNRRSDNGRSVSYRACPIYWQRAIRLAGLEWEGKSQTGRTVEMRVPSDWEPAETASA